MFSPNKFVVIIKENESSVTYLKGKQVVSYFSGDFVAQKAEFTKIFTRDRFANIIVILGNKEQEYSQEKMPANSLDEAEKIMKQKLKEGYDENVFRGSVASADPYSYVFINIRLNDLIKSWFDYLLGLPNYLNAIYSLEIEKQLLQEYKGEQFENEDILISYLSAERKNKYKLYHPAISSFMLTEKLSFIMNLLLSSGIILMIIIFTFLFVFVK